MIQTLISNSWPDYELIDSGNGRKLERYGKYTLIRPENEALWKPSLSNAEWQNADAAYEKKGERGEWRKLKSIPNQWEMSFENLKFYAKLTPFGHTGVFPEQSVHWDWIQEKIRTCHPELDSGSHDLPAGKAEIPGQARNDKNARTIKILSLFTYTGISTLAAAAAGAHSTHIDASGPAVTWARENQKLSNLEQKPVRWIVEDAIKFVQREIRRGNQYDAIIMDPPKFGRGPSGELWKFEESLPMLLDLCAQILVPNPLFVLVTAYAILVSSVTLSNLLSQTMSTKGGSASGRNYQGNIEYGELVLQDRSHRLLSTSIFAQWSR